MRQLPDTRAHQHRHQHHSDSSSLLVNNNKRLTNGYAKDHMTTRSKSKDTKKKKKINNNDKKRTSSITRRGLTSRTSSSLPKSNSRTNPKIKVYRSSKRATKLTTDEEDNNNNSRSSSAESGASSRSSSVSCATSKSSCCRLSPVVKLGKRSTKIIDKCVQEESPIKKKRGRPRTKWRDGEQNNNNNNNSVLLRKKSNVIVNYTKNKTTTFLKNRGRYMKVAAKVRKSSIIINNNNPDITNEKSKISARGNVGNPRRRNYSNTTSETTASDHNHLHENQDLDDDENSRAQKAIKRRSALWQLNCEAESFLFGETAADKHEIELPPLSSPPAKKRRMRTNELGTLLKETPILGSKLRNLSCSPLSPCSPNKRLKAKDESLYSRSPPQFNRDYYGLELNINSPPPHYIHEPTDTNESSPPTSVRISTILSNMEWRFSFEDIPSSEVWYQTFSRQESPQGTFVSPYRTPVILPYESKHNGRRAQTKMPKLPRKSPRCHASTLAMLSSCGPRTRHASSTATNTTTINVPSLASPPLTSPTALLKSSPPPVVIKTERRPMSPPPIPQNSSSSYSTRSSSSAITTIHPSTSTNSLLSLSISLPSSSLCTYSSNSSSSLLTTTTNTTSMQTSSTTTTTKSSSSSCHPLVNQSLQPNKNYEMTATQYLWDAVQYLSDPYVINLLANDDVSTLLSSNGGSSKKLSVTNNSNICNTKVNSSATTNVVNNCQIKSWTIQKAELATTLDRRLRSDVQQQQSTNGSPPASPPLRSPRHSVAYSKCNCNCTNSSSSSPAHSPRAENRSPISPKSNCRSSSPNNNSSTTITNHHHHHHHHNNNSTTTTTNNTISCSNINNNNISAKTKKGLGRKSPVVLVSDIFKSNKPPTLDKKHVFAADEENVLFLMDGLPPLPSWPD